MTVLVAFDGQELSTSALGRAREFATVREERLVAVTVVPTSESYARERNWIDEGEPFEVERVIDYLRERVERIAPGATFRYELVDEFAPPGTIADRIRRVADHVAATVVFVGSEDAGGLVAPLSSVGGTVSAGDGYDVYIHRRGDGASDGGDR